METTRTETIRRLNDEARQAMGIRCRLVQTAGIAALSEAAQSKIREIVETYDDFSEANDPYGEHDFGNFTYEGDKIYWKIDYYNKTLDGGSEDPANPALTTRVLTILLASEY
jgi:hypothetical protein